MIIITHIKKMLQQVYKVYRTFVCVFFFVVFFNKHLHLYIKTQIMTKYVHANEIKKKRKERKELQHCHRF